MTDSSPRSRTAWPGKHPPAEQLQAFAVGRVPQGEAASIETHVLGCETCRLVLESAPDDDMLKLVQATGDPTPESRLLRLVPGYEIIDELGRGGMGVVYRARQIALGRLVALKLIARGGQADPQELARFRIEAEAAARLQHPNIVQVFDVGEQDGQPYLAMELLSGGTLAERLAGRPLAPRNAAELLATLAAAVQHAHQLGVVHRDLKPANVLLSSGTKPEAGADDFWLDRPLAKITDFGLAKRLDVGTERTQTGVLLGTPGYMAPEQAAADGATIDERVDVYALGAVLYEVLTGRPPFRGTSVLETLDQVRAADPVPPGQLQPSVPCDLETICLKCLEKEAGRRYSSAEALADDLQRFLQHRPIQARPANSMQRLIKWARRRPAQASLIAVSAVATFSLLVGAVLYNVNLRAALREADDNLSESYEAVYRMLEQVGFEELADFPKMEQKREAMLVDAVALYEKLLARQPYPDPVARRRHQVALMRLGRMHDLLGHKEQAEHRLLRAIELQEVMAEEFFDEPEYIHDLAVSRINLGLARHADRDPAADQYQRAIALLEPIQQRFPSSRKELALALNNLATITKDIQEAERYHDDALVLRLDLAAEQPAAADRQNDVAQTRYNLALLYYRTGRPALAEEALREAIESWEQLSSEYPDSSAYQSALAQCYMTWGSLLHDTGRWPEGEQVLRQGIKLLEVLAGDFPKVLQRQTELARGHNTLGALLIAAGRSQDALPELEQALVLHETIQQGSPSPAHRSAIAETLTNLAMVYSHLQRTDDATDAFAGALVVFEELAHEHPQEPHYAIVLGINCMNFSNVVRATDPEQALELNDRSVDLLELAFASAPGRTDIRSYVLNSHGARAQTLAALNRQADAVADWDRIVELADDASRRSYRFVRVLILARVDTARAASEADELEAAQDAPAADLYNLACVFSLCAEHVLREESGTIAQRESQAASYADRAVALLTDQGLAKFFETPANAKQLQSDADFRALADHPGYKRLVEQLTQQPID